MTASSTAETNSGAPGIGGPTAARVTLRIALPVGLFLMALGVRLVSWHAVFGSDRIHPHGSDAFYHLRRIKYAVDHFPASLSFDPFINFPHGAEPIWPPTFDWLVALVIRLGVGPGETESMERWVMWVTPLLGALTVVWVYFLGKRFFSRTVGVLGAALLALLPAHFSYSQLGFADHHVAVSLISTGILWAGMRLMSEEPLTATSHASGPRALTGSLASAAWLGLALGAAILVWPGSLIHVAVVQVALVARLLLAPERGQAVWWSRHVALLHVVTFALVLPLAAGNEWQRWGSFSPVVLSNFQPIYFGSAAALFWICAELWERWSLCERSLVRALVAAALFAGAVTILFGLIPELRAGAADSWAWLSRQEEFQAVVAESEPILFGSASLDWQWPATLFSYFIYIVPICLAACSLKEWRRSDRAFFLWWTLAFGIATLSQRRFMNSFAIPYALLMAHCAAVFYRWITFRIAERGWMLWGVRIASGAALLALLTPIPPYYRYHIDNLLRASHGEAPVRSGASREIQLVVDSARWLRDNSPPPEGQGYSVLGPWGDGHVLKYAARRPVVQDNFGDDVGKENFALAERYFAAPTEPEALDILDQTRARYVLVRSTGSGHGSGYEPESMFSRLYFARGSRGRFAPSRDARATQVTALTQHRLIYESPALEGSNATANPASYVKLFEVVPGALLVGNARAGGLVAIRLEMESRNAGPFVYKAMTRANSDGRYSLRLPYSNEDFSPNVDVADSYEIVSQSRTASFVVSEQAVLMGQQIEGPSF